ncbi:Armadillo-like helical-containing protein [Dioscorea alata]|uniref:Armadillo-like helical-containing protein n=1 Tax=Dioscorea alata TaxID=55571 RepID=A0ACB7WD99_DIOAL|nr:Armadillo-like helical-containing protein [Dioscorea alata]
MSRSQPQPKMKPPPRPLFTCGLFRHCTDSVLSPTAATSPPPSSSVPNPSPPPPTPPPPTTTTAPHPAPDLAPSSSSSSSSSASHSFTQWRFPLSHPHPPPDPPAPILDAFHAAELHFASGARLPALRLLERAISPDPSTPGGDRACPAIVMAGVVESLRDPETARAAAKVLLALVLGEGNRRLAVELGAVGAAVHAVGAGGATAERALAALELMCGTAEGAEVVRGHAMAGVALAKAAEGMGERGRECAIGVMAAAWGGAAAGEAPVEVGRAVVVALQKECGGRGRRKGTQLLKALKESGRLDLPGEF